MWAVKIVLLTVSPSGFLRQELFLYETAAHMCRADSYSLKHLRGPLRRLMELFLCIAPFSPEAYSSIQNHLGLPQIQSLLPQLSEVKWLYLGYPSLHWDLKIASRKKAGPWKGSPHLLSTPSTSGITDLHCLLFNIWKYLFHVFCPVSCLWLMGKFRMLLPHSQKT